MSEDYSRLVGSLATGVFILGLLIGGVLILAGTLLFALAGML